MSPREASDAKPPLRFSIVTAVYNVARYLDDFIESIEGQTFPREQFEVIAVDDGSTDESLAMLRAWEQRRPGLVTVVTKENGGQSSARNVGKSLARGSWVTFTDPDDIIAPDYLLEVAMFLEEHPTVSLIATNRLILNDSTGVVTEAHPLKRHFRHGNRLRDIGHYPDYFHGSAPAAFFPLEEVRRQQLEFDSSVRPNFEDGHFCCHYLLGIERPAIGFVATAHYHYRKRQDGSSTLQESLGNPGRYTHVLRNGYLDVLRRGAEKSGTGEAPEWLQNFVLYELSWYFSSQDAHAGAVTGAVGPVADEFHELLAQILGYISKDVITGFSVRPLKPAWKDLLLHGYDAEPWHQQFGHVIRLDRDQSLVKITYRFTGVPPVEELLSGGELVSPTHAKTRDLGYYGRVLLRERILWLSSRRSIRLRLDGRDLDLQFSVPQPNHTLLPGQIKRRLDRRVVPAGRVNPNGRRSIMDRLIRRLARTRLVRHFFGDAWVLMDRVHDAGDSGELLFRYLRKSRRKINAWFVIEAGTVDWHRLRADGYRRVVPHGSLRWKLLMANCRHLISSHADVPVMRPHALLALMDPRWRFTFLQHGVIKDDLSGWLNAKSIDLFITSTPQEHVSIAGDHTRYTFTTKEVKLTGLPRFDRLREIGERVPVEKRDLVLLAPTWRTWLSLPLGIGSQRRTVDGAFFESDFVQSWTSLLKSPQLAEVCEQESLIIGFLPHPNLQPALSGMGIPRHVRPLTFADNDVQELFARSAVLVTDYSSIGFNAAYIDRPVVYFQFDSGRVFGGEHVGSRGYFDYERDGFGPVAYTVEQAVETIIDTIRCGRSPSPLYRARIEATFPQRDGRCCQRVVQAIKDSTRRLTPTVAAVPEPTPRVPES